MADALTLSRLQFAANVSFHILFPMITIALAWVLLFFKLRFDRTQDPKWMNAYRLWVKVFALTFALGVVSGITMSFQFGTNWPGFMNTVGNIAGPLLAYEVLTAFFLEATFLGVMLFGFNRVSNRVHTAATVLVAVGTSLSAFWILALVSWMHTPAGFEMRDGVAHVTSWTGVIFNPSFGYRMLHTMLASFLTVSFLLAGLSAYRISRGDATPAAAVTLRVGIVLAAILAPVQIVAGDAHGLNTLEHQPAKIAAMEALWETRSGAPLVLFGIPDGKARTNHYALELPGVASLILTHDPDGIVQGIDRFPDSHPPVAALFWAFRIMVGIGVLMLAVSWMAALHLKRRGDLSPQLSRILVAMTFAGWVGVLSGWYTTEIGRQPWLVAGVLRTKDAVTSVPAGSIGTTLVLYLLLYVVLIVAYVSVVFHLARQAGLAETKASGPAALGPAMLPARPAEPGRA
jgi:cytochrome bd ubiquinol oxidase subunit I